MIDFAKINVDVDDGLVAIGGELSIENLLSAYTNGIFPWYEKEPILWYCPNPRMIITKESLHISKSLKKIIKQNKFEIRINTCFEKVIDNCSNIYRKDQKGTWITTEMKLFYIKLHQAGFCQSYEVFLKNKLVGGLYGVTLKGVFFGESMFSIVNNASKVALCYLLQNSKYSLVDCQVESTHLKLLGAYNISRNEFRKKLSYSLN